MRTDASWDVVVVGGGLAGLACAVGVVDASLRVLVLEATAELGGRARSWTDRASGDVVDIGPHILLSEYPNMRALLARLGTEDAVLWQTEKLIRLIDERGGVDMYERSLPPPLHLLPSLAKVRSLSLRDKASNGRITWRAMQLDEADVAALDGLSAAELLRHCGVSARFTEWFWASACMSLLNLPLERCSAGALLRVYAQLISHRHARFGFPTRGLGELFAPDAERAIVNGGGGVRRRSKVTRLLHDGSRIRGVLLEDGARVACDSCVLAVPPTIAANLLAAVPPLDHIAANAARFEPCPYVSVYLWLDRKLSQERFWCRLWRPDNLNTDFYDLSNIRAGWRGRPSVIASNIIYSHRAHALSDEEIVLATRGELAEAVPAAASAEVVHALVNRVEMAIPCPTPGSEAWRAETHTGIEGLLLAGDWTRTELPACMESAVRSGWLAAEAICKRAGRRRTLARRVRPPEGFAGLVNRISRGGEPACDADRAADGRRIASSR